MIPESIGHVVDGLAELIDVCDTIRFVFFLNLERTLMGWCAPPLLFRFPSLPFPVSEDLGILSVFPLLSLHSTA